MNSKPITHPQSLDEFYKQIQFVLDTYSNHLLSNKSYNNIVISGLGGSGIGGRIVKDIFISDATLPIEVYSEYQLPNYVNDKTLVILSSYSGNTEETLSMYADAKNSNATIICICSGGKILDLAKADNNKYYMVETGFQPRMALGYSLSTLILILSELFNKDYKTELKQVVKNLQNNQAHKDEAKRALSFFSNTLTQKFVVLTDFNYQNAAVRFCQQVQENAKMESYVSVLPEANHNAIETYNKQHPTNFIVLNSGSNKRTNIRFQFVVKQLINQKNKVYELAKSNYNLKSLYNNIHVMDWISIYLSEELQTDNMTVPVITKLKEYLNKK